MNRINRLSYLISSVIISLCFLPAYSMGVESDETTLKNDTLIRDLNEIVVEAKKEIHTADADIIYLSKRNREFGTNALDALSSLRQFTPMLSGTSLVTADMKPVAIMINGRQATAQELRGYTGKEIKKVTYYPVAPLRYSDITDGPLVDVEISVNKDYISIYLSASHAVNTGYGNDQLVVRWADSLNLVRADYFMDYRDLRYSNTERYTYPAIPSSDRDYNTRSKYKGHYQYGKLSWQNTSHNNLWYISAMFINNPGTRDYDNISADEEEDRGYTRSLESCTNSGNLNVFFRRNVERGRIEAQANGSLGHTTSDNLIDSDKERGFSSSFRNNSYRGYGKILYYTPVKKIGLFLTGIYSYQGVELSQTLPVSLDYTTTYNTLYLSAAISGNVKKNGRSLSYGIGIATDYQDIRRTGTELSLQRWQFTPYINLGAYLSRAFFIRMRGSIKSGSPSIGQLMSDLSYQGENLAWSGNPDLKGWTQYSLSIQPQLSVIPKKLILNGDFSFRYVDDPIMPCAVEGSPVVMKSMNVSGSRNVEGNLNVSVQPCDMVSVKPYFEWMYNNFRTPSQKIDRGYFRYGCSVAFSHKRFQCVVNANAPYKVFSGDMIEYGDWQLSATALVKLPKSLTASISWSRSSQHDRTSIMAPGIISYEGNSCIPRMGNKVSLGLTWSFSHGVFRKRNQAQVSDMNPDSGLNDYNKAKM